MLTVVKLSFDEYLLDNGTDDRYELVNGERVLMRLGTGLHGQIAKRIERLLDDQCGLGGQGWTALRFSITVQSPRGGRWDMGRIPDVVLLPVVQWQGMEGREAAIRLNEPPPLLVVEVVSPSTQGDDYRAKWVEYSALNIPEYWIVDPLAEMVTIAVLDQGRYQDSVFRGDDRVVSVMFPGLGVTVRSILTGL